MHSERSKPRISPTDFIDFKVHLKGAEVSLNGYLGNVSEGGMCAIIPSAQLGDDAVNLPLEGTIQSPRLPKEMKFNGRLAWHSSTDIRKENHLLIGIQFADGTVVPDELIAIGMSVE